MERHRLILDHHLHSRSSTIIWQLISTAGGLMKWVADEVSEQKGKMQFTWGDPWGHHETRTATIINKVKNKSISFRWDDEPDEEAYLELQMLRNELTGDFMLRITDYALPEDEGSLTQIWEQNLERLHHTTGL
jgi:uncharacterized protein YndB with AHSA1/START domain